MIYITPQAHACDVMVTATENGHDNMSSNPG